MKTFLHLLFPVVTAFSPMAFAGLPGPDLVKDIAPGEKNSLDYENPFLPVGDTVFFSATDNKYGPELWRSDGTAAGTEMVKDLRVGSFGSGPRQFHRAGSLFYFVATDPSYGQELWKSDGTKNGTAMVEDIAPGIAGSYPRLLGAAGNTVYLTANVEASSGGQLWKADGTPAGATLITTISPLFAGGRVGIYEGTALGSNYYFRVDRGATPELWRTNGTAFGTTRVGTTQSVPVAAGGRLFYIANDGMHGSELWQSDGTVRGASMVKDIAPGSVGSVSHLHLVAAGKLVYFSARTGAEPAPLALWRSDGSAAGTYPLMVLAEPSDDMYAWGDHLYFTPALPGGPSEVWRTDGTVAGTGPLKPGTPNRLRFFADAGSSAYFSGSLPGELWQSDGTAPGTHAVAELNVGSTTPIVHGDNDPVLANGKIFFGAYNAPLGKELYTYDTTKPSIARPIVSEITATSARVDLALNPNGFVTWAKFEYGQTDSYGSTMYLPVAAGEGLFRFQRFSIPLSGLAADSVVHYRISGSSEKGTRVATGTLSTSPLERWRLARFGSLAHLVTAADDQDPDHDGLSNLIEYAFGLDPNRADAGDLPRGRKEAEGMIFEFTHPEGQEDVVYGVEWSPTMAPGSWTAVPDTGSGNHHRFVVETNRKPRVFTRWTVNPR